MGYCADKDVIGSHLKTDLWRRLLVNQRRLAFERWCLERIDFLIRLGLGHRHLIKIRRG